MKTFSTVASFAALAGVALGQGSTPIINTPAAVVQCQPALLSFSGGQAPYFLSVLPGGQTAAAPLEQLPQQAAAGSFTWTVNIAAGTSISLQIRDGTGAVNYASEITVQSSNDASCLGSTPTSAAAGGGGVASSAATTTSRASGIAAASTALTSTAATATVTAGSGAPATNVTTNNGTTIDADTYNFTCTTGLLSYAITVATLDIPLEQATSFFSNWTGAAPGPVTNSSGTGVGSRRTYAPQPGVSISEQLITDQTNRTTGSLHQQWNLTAPVTINTTVINSAFQDLTVYTNTTTNTTDAQWFILACPSEQASGLQALTAFINQGIAYFQEQIGGGNSTSTSGPAAVTAAPAKLRRRISFA